MTWAQPISEEDEFWFDAAIGASHASHDRHSRVGCVVLARDGRMVITSNRIPNGVRVDHEERYEREEKKYWIEHAELSAIFKAAALGMKLQGGALYCTRFPCAGCARGIVSARLARVVTPRPEIDHPRWGESFRRSVTILSESPVAVFITGEPPSRQQGEDAHGFGKEILGHRARTPRLVSS